MNGNDIYKALEEAFPRTLAYEWDNVGVMIGTMNKPITHVFVTLDVTKDCLKAAKEAGADLIIAHHPLIFTAFNAIHYDTYKGQLIRDIIKSDITIFAAHTNYDIARGGMNDMLAMKLGLVQTTQLSPVDETHGLGRIGKFPSKIPLNDAIKSIKTALDIPDARYIGAKGNKTIETVALIGGSGSDFASQAKAKGADLYITGDVTYHKAHEMLEMGLCVLDVGHSAEKHFKQALRDWMKTRFSELKISIYEPSQNPYMHV